MPLEGLAKTKSLLVPRTQVIDPRMWPVATWEHNWWSWIKPFVKSLGSKESWRCLKTMPKWPLVDKRDMHKKINLKKSTKSLRSKLGLKFNKKYEHVESMSNECKVSNALTISKDAEVRARGARALAACVNSLTHPKVKLCPNRHRVTRGGGA
jgi:hypothetical protein